MAWRLSCETRLCWGRSGGPVRIRGEVVQPGEHAKADLRIGFEDVPLDASVLSLFDRGVRDGLSDVFAFPDQRLARLTQRRLAFEGESSEVSPQRRAELEDAAGSFLDASDRRPTPELTGRVRVLRDPSHPGPEKSRITTTLDLTGTQLSYRHWPYPLTATGGELILRPDRAELIALELRGPTGAHGVVNGEWRVGRDVPPDPDLRITNIRLPIDDYLLASLPEEAAAFLKNRVQPQGRVYGSAVITPHPEPRPGRETDFRANVNLDGVSIRPQGGRWQAEQLGGRVVVTREAVALENVSGRHGDGTVYLRGRIDLPEHDPSGSGQEQPLPPPRFALTLGGRGVAVDSAVLDAVPRSLEVHGQLAAFFEDHRPELHGDVELRLDTTADTFMLLAEPTRGALDYGGERVRGEAMSGSLSYADGVLVLDRLTSATGAGRIEAEGRVQLGTRTAAAHMPQDDRLDEKEEAGDTDADLLTALAPGPGTGRTDLRVRGRIGLDEPAALAFLPPAVQAVHRSLALGGPIETSDFRLTGNAEQTRLEARLRLDGVGADLGVALSELTGDLRLEVRSAPIEQAGAGDGSAVVSDIGTEVDAVLSDGTARVSGRRLLGLEAEVVKDPQADVAKASLTAGELYGGRVTGSASFPVDGHTPYTLDLTVLGAAFNPVSEPTPEYERQAQQDPGGRLSASLRLRGVPGAPERLEGRGDLRLEEAALLDDSAGIAALRALNFAMPSGVGLSRAQSSFLVEGRTVRLDEVRLMGSGLILEGGGRVTLPDTTVDLVLFTRNQGAPSLGPISDFLNAIKDELLGLRVTGTVAEPRIRVESLSNLRDDFEADADRTARPITLDP